MTFLSPFLPNMPTHVYGAVFLKRKENDISCLNAGLDPKVELFSKVRISRENINRNMFDGADVSGISKHFLCYNIANTLLVIARNCLINHP